MRGVPGLLARRRARQVGSEAERLRAAMIPAPVTEADARPGSLTPEARRQLDEALATGARTAAEARTGERPYAGITASQVAAYRLAAASEFFVPRPVFDPVPGRAPETAPMAAVPGNAKVPPPPPAAAPAPAGRHALTAGRDTADARLLRRVRDAMERKWRAESFIADKRELPCFAATTRAVGWQGLHMPPQALGWQRWSTERWADREQALAAAGHAKALAELDEIHARYAAQALADGDAA